MWRYPVAGRLMVAAALAAVGGAAIAQGSSAGSSRYPEKPLRLVVPFPPGGAADIVARLIAQKLTDALSTQVIADNRAGAGGAIGTEYVARASPDGYTLLFSSSSPIAIRPHLDQKTPYDPVSSFTPVVMVGYAPEVLVVHPSFPARTVKEVIALAKSRPQGVSFGSSGIGTIIHVTGELFAQRARVLLLHVPYKGAAPATIATISGQVTMLFAAYPSVAAQLKAEKLRAIAVTSLSRVSIAPELPTIAEAALPGFESSQWWGVSGPAALPAAIVSRLNVELNKALQSEDMRKRLALEGAEPGGGKPEAFADYVRKDSDKWRQVIRTAGIKSE